MRIVQIASGKFHHFHLARHLHGVGDLEAIFTAYPWFKLRDEGLPRNRVRSYPWLLAPYMAAGRLPWASAIPRLRRQWEWMIHESIDRYAAHHLPSCDVVVGLSGSALRAGRKAQQRGGKYVFDRGSAHIRSQNEILQEEHSRWGVRWDGIDSRVVEKEDEECAAADLITVPSQFAYDSFVAKGITSERILKIPYGANTARFSAQGGPEKDRFVVLFVGNITLQKGIPYLLSAFQQFHHPNKALWLVGHHDGSLRRVLKQFDLAKVIFMGTVANDRLAYLYSKANVLVLPSVQEGLAMVQGEALACGCPVIATDNTGASDLFTHGKEGFIVPIRQPESIAKRLTQLADEPELREKMSEAALARVKEIGGWEDYGRNYRRALKQLVGESTDIEAVCHQALTFE
jgi:starch synthase